jgi:hypothetical protein
MKTLVAALIALLPVTAMAQTTEPAAPAAPAAPGLDTPIEQLLANEKIKAIIDARIPGLSSHPMLDQFKVMSLNQLMPMAGGQLTDAMLAAVAADLAAGK